MYTSPSTYTSISTSTCSYISSVTFALAMHRVHQRDVTWSGFGSTTLPNPVGFDAMAIIYTPDGDFDPPQCLMDIYLLSGGSARCNSRRPVITLRSRSPSRHSQSEPRRYPRRKGSINKKRRSQSLFPRDPRKPIISAPLNSLASNGDRLQFPAREQESLSKRNPCPGHGGSIKRKRADDDMTAERTNRADADVTAEQIAPVAQTIVLPVDHAGAKLTTFFRRTRHQPAEPTQLHTASTKMANSATGTR